MNWQFRTFTDTLQTDTLGRHIIFKEETASTNDDAKSLIRAGSARAGSVIIAERQTQGRGREGRPWVSPPGNLIASLILRTSLPLARLASTSLIAGLALWQTLSPLLRFATLTLKWPNDLLINGKKCAGILVESNLMPESQNEIALVIGLGLNIAETPPPDHCRLPPTSLRDEAISIARESLFAAFLNALEPLWATFEQSGFAPFRSAYLDASQILGSMVTIDAGTAMLKGKVHDLTATGALLVEQTSGQIIPVYSGDLYDQKPIARH